MKGSPVRVRASAWGGAGVCGTGRRSWQRLLSVAVGEAEPQLRAYGLSGGVVAEGMTHGPAFDAAGTWNEWYAPYALPGNAEEAIRVRTSRRAVAAGSQRRARSIDESRSESVGELLMHANRNRLSELHARAQAKGDKDAVRERLEELFETADRIGADDSAWLPARLTIDDEPVEARETEVGWMVAGPPRRRERGG
jgi:hypothetical protein